MNNIKVPEFLFFLIKSLTREEKRYFKMNSGFQLEKEKLYIEMFDAIDKMERYDEKTLLKYVDKNKNKLSVSKNFLYNKILQSLRAYNERSSMDIELYNLVSDAQILMEKELFDSALKRLKKAKKLAIRYEKSLVFVEIVNLEMDIQTYIGGKETKEKYEELFGHASDTLQNYMQNLKLKKLNRTLLDYQVFRNEAKQIKRYTPKIGDFETLHRASHKIKVILQIKVEKDYEDFTYSDAFEIITHIENLINKQNVKLKKIERGSTILTLELDYEDALKLIGVIQEGKLQELGISDAKIKGFIGSQVYSNALSPTHTTDNFVESENIVNDSKRNCFVSKMKETLTSDIERTILLVKGNLKESSPKFNDIIMIAGKYNRLKKDSINGVSKKEYLEITNSEITNSLLKLLDSLELSDL